MARSRATGYVLAYDPGFELKTILRELHEKTIQSLDKNLTIYTKLATLALERTLDAT
jgi:hypothetical protein